MENLYLMMAPLFSSKLLIVLFFGTLFGLILGVLPGLGPTTGGALILPFTMTLDPLSAIVLLTSIYCAGTYGGAITAVLINTPGTPAAAMGESFMGCPTTQDSTINSRQRAPVAVKAPRNWDWCSVSRS